MGRARDLLEETRQQGLLDRQAQAVGREYRFGGWQEGQPLVSIDGAAPIPYGTWGSRGTPQIGDRIAVFEGPSGAVAIGRDALPEPEIRRILRRRLEPLWFFDGFGYTINSSNLQTGVFQWTMDPPLIIDSEQSPAIEFTESSSYQYCPSGFGPIEGVCQFFSGEGESSQFWVTPAVNVTTYSTSAGDTPTADREAGQFSAGRLITTTENIPIRVDLRLDLTGASLGGGFQTRKIEITVYRLRSGFSAPGYTTMLAAAEFANPTATDFYSLIDSNDWFGANLSAPAEALAWVSVVNENAIGDFGNPILEYSFSTGGWEIYQTFSLFNPQFFSGESLDKLPDDGYLDLTFQAVSPPEDDYVESFVPIEAVLVESSATTTDPSESGTILTYIAAGSQPPYYSDDDRTVSVNPDLETASILVPGTYLIIATTSYSGNADILAPNFPGQSSSLLPPDTWNLRVALGAETTSEPPWRL